MPLPTAVRAVDGMAAPGESVERGTAVHPEPGEPEYTEEQSGGEGGNGASEG